MALGSWLLRKKSGAKGVKDRFSMARSIDFVIGKQPWTGKRETEPFFMLADDKSLLYNRSLGDYSIMLGGNWRYELIVNSKDGLCVKIQCFLAELNAAHVSMELPEAQKKNVYVNNKDILYPGGGCHYLPFEDKVYWDPQKHILCIGKKDCVGETVEFAERTFAVIDNGKLLCIYLNLDELSDCVIF